MFQTRNLKKITKVHIRFFTPVSRTHQIISYQSMFATPTQHSKGTSRVRFVSKLIAYYTSSSHSEFQSIVPNKSNACNLKFKFFKKKSKIMITNCAE